VTPTSSLDPHAVFRRHSRTFSAAAALLAPSAQDAIATVYLFCRTVDDLADEHADADALAALADELRGLRPPSPTTAGLLALRPLGVPIDAAAQLVDGCRTDLGAVRVPDEAALVRYGYLVAGTVGRLTSPLLGVTDPTATRFAVDLGIGMQLSNIARDVGEDAARDRVYLPATWLAEAGLGDSDVLRGGRDADVATVVARTVALAERYYDSAERGFPAIPLRARVAVAWAARRYRDIGREAVRRGASAVRSRTVLPRHRQAWWLAAAPFVALSAGTGPHDDALHAPLLGLLGPEAT
jgi:phytoene synthase